MLYLRTVIQEYCNATYFLYIIIKAIMNYIISSLYCLCFVIEIKYIDDVYNRDTTILFLPTYRYIKILLYTLNSKEIRLCPFPLKKFHFYID